MIEKEYSDEEIEELDKYLYDDWNHEIYEELCGEDYSDYEGLFEPLEFFRILYFQTKFIETNKFKPLFVARHLKTLDYSEAQLDFIFDKIDLYFFEDKKTDDQIKVCCREIQKLRNNLSINKVDEVQNNENYSNPYNFQIVLNHLETLNSLREKISYLIEIKTSFLQSHYSTFSSIPSFDTQCQLEIDKLHKLAQLKPSESSKVIHAAKHPDLTIDRTILLFERIIPTFKEQDATKKAEFINFVTGFDYETVRQRFSSLYKKTIEKPNAYNKDIPIVKKYLRLAGYEIKSKVNK